MDDHGACCGILATMRKIGVFFDPPDYDDYPFNQEEYSIAYHELARKLHDKGGEFWIVRGQETFLGGNRFSHGWRFDGREFVHADKPVELDLVYDKSTKIKGYFKADASTDVINDRELDDLCVDKWKTYQLFPEYSPKTAFVDGRDQLEDVLRDFPDDNIVMKPVDGEEGRGVIIGPKRAILEAKPEYPVLVQEFLDTSGGIPGIIESLHDLRLHSIGGELVFAYIRSPAPGKLLANVAQGGTEREVLIKDVPKEALQIFRDIDARLTRFPRRVYSIDIGRGKQGAWKVIELNSKPGLSYQGRGPGYRMFQEKLAEAFLQ